MDPAAAGRHAGRAAGRRLALRPDAPAGSQQTEIKPWRTERWGLPPEADAELVGALAEGLDVSHRPSDETRPRVGLDEASQPRVGAVSAPLPVEPGPPARFDSEDSRHGTAPLFLVSRPLRGGRGVKVTQRRTAVDFAEVIPWRVEEGPEEAAKVVLGMDHLNTPKRASLAAALPPERARRNAEKVAIPPRRSRGAG